MGKTAARNFIFFGGEGSTGRTNEWPKAKIEGDDFFIFIF